MALIEYGNKNSPVSQLVGSMYSPQAIPAMDAGGISSLTTSPINVALGLAKRMGTQSTPLAPVKGLENTAMAFGNLGKGTKTAKVTETISESVSPKSFTMPFAPPPPPIPPINPPMYNPANIPPSVYASLAPPAFQQQQQSVISSAAGGGGIRSLPTRPIIGGQQHELSYITPEESRLLRQHGGGVTPNGGQLKVGGLNTYWMPIREMKSDDYAADAADERIRFGEGPVLPGVWWDQEEQDRLDAFIDSGGFTDMRYDPERDRRRAENWRRRFPEEHQRMLEEGERKFGSDILRPIPRPRIPADTIGRDPFTTDPTPSPVAPPIQEDPVVPVQDEPVADTPGRDPFDTDPTPMGKFRWMPPSLPRGIGPSVDPLLLPPPPGWSYEGPDRTSQVPSNFQQILPYISNTGIQNLTPPTTSNTVVPMGAQQLNTPLNTVGEATEAVESITLDTPVNPAISSQPQGQTNPVAGQFMPWQYTPLNQPLTNPLQNNVAGNVNLQQQPLLAQAGGGIRGLINQSNKNYSVRNQDNFSTSNDAFGTKPFSATPDSNLLSGEGYISNILGGHTIPLGLSNPQQLQKPLEAFPTGGQMNYDNTLQADYSRPQSFYAMPNMNRMT